VGNDLFMTHFSFSQQVTGSDLNTLQRDIDTEVRQLRSEIRQLESSIASTKSSLKHDMVMAEIATNHNMSMAKIATKHDIVMAGYATETSILKFLGFLVLCVVGTLIAVTAIDAIATFIIENR
jgi:hypothetical protein